MKASRRTKGKGVKDLHLKKSGARAVKGGGLVHESLHAKSTGEGASKTKYDSAKASLNNIR